jgi:hypothetical protein
MRVCGGSVGRRSSMGWLVLNEKERQDLVKLLMEHLDYGWV